MNKIKKIEIKEKLLKQIGKFADEKGYEIYIVGGYVRDLLLDRKREDFDITVHGDSIKFAKLLAEHFNTKAVIYERFRTALVPIGAFKVEFVGTRKEVYEENSRNPIVTEGTLEDDIKRRDFTINAMAASLNEDKFGEIIDLFNGYEDLNDKILRTPLEPETTYDDDPLRMMRAARFASQLRFRIEEKSYEAIKKMSDRIKIISQERISDEFLKILSSPQPSIGLNILFQTGLLQYFFPELQRLAGVERIVVGERVHNHKDVFYHTLKVVDNIALKTDNLWLRFAALMHDIAKPQTKKFNDQIGWSFHGHEEIGARMMKKIFHRMRFPLEHLEYVEKLVRLHQRPMSLLDDDISDSAYRRLAANAGNDLNDLFTLCKADITTKDSERETRYLQNYEVVFQKVIDVQLKDKLAEFQSPVRGEEIMEICNITPSRLVGYLKTKIEDAILDGLIQNDYEDAKAYFIVNKKDWINEFEKLNLGGSKK